jgi:hypothetical protein
VVGARRALGWAGVVVGALLTIVGLALAVTFGPDDRVSSGPHRFESKGAAIITAPAALAYSGPTLEVTATSPGRPLFVGLAYDVDVRDYLANTSYTRIDDIDLPWKTTASTVDGDGLPVKRPVDVDMWLVSSQGDGTSSLRFTLPDSAVDLVVMDGDLDEGIAADVTMRLVEDGAFLAGVALSLSGLGIAAAGWLSQRTAAPGSGGRRPPRAGRHQAARRDRDRAPAEDAP